MICIEYFQAGERSFHGSAPRVVAAILCFHTCIEKIIGGFRRITVGDVRRLIGKCVV